VRLTATLWADLAVISAPQHSTQHGERRLGELLWLAAVTLRWAAADCTVITFMLVLTVVGGRRATRSAPSARPATTAHPSSRCCAAEAIGANDVFTRTPTTHLRYVIAP